MPLAPADRSLLDPAALAAHSFATGFRGYDQDEVRRFLGQVADAVGRLVDAQVSLERRLANAESRAAAPRPFDEAELTTALGEETARVLMAARQAATDIRAKAEEGAARLLEDAANEAASRRRAADEHAAEERAAVTELRQTAEAELARRRSQSEAQAAEAGRVAEAAAAEVRAAAAADVERLLEDARADADARRADAIAAAAAARAEADADVGRRRAEAKALLVARAEEADRDAQRIRADAEEERTRAVADAEAQRQAAEEEGRAMVDEAQLVRERILKDLARRRRTARGQLEQLRVARERLLEAYEVVRRTLDEATGELRVALPEARLAAEEAGRRAESEPEVSVDNLEAELEMARAAGLPIVMVDDRTTDPSTVHHDLSGHPSPTEVAEGAEAETGAEAAAETDSAIGAIPDVGEVPDVRIIGVVAGEGVEAAPTHPTPSEPDVAPQATQAGPELEPSSAVLPPPAEATSGDGGPDSEGMDGGATIPAPTAESPADDRGQETETTGGAVASPATAAGPVAPDASPEFEVTETAFTPPEATAEPSPEPEAPESVAAGNHPEPEPGSAVTVPAVPTAGPEADVVTPGPEPAVRSVEDPAPEPVGDSGSESEIPGPTAIPPPVDDPSPGEAAPPDDASPERPSEAHDDAAVRAEVDALFDRIRASREAVAGPATDAAEPAEPSLPASTEGDTADEGLVTMLERRDSAIEGVEHRLARRLKRVLADEQSAVLDTVRRSRSLPGFDEVLPSPADHIATYVEAARDDLAAAAEAGAGFADGSPPANGALVDDLAAHLADELTGRLRPRLERCFVDVEVGEGDGSDEEELTDRVRACYREWKTTQITEVVRHVVLAAFSRGQYDALPAGTLLQWVIDDSGQPCPDAEDNALAGAVSKGDPFPTGHSCPPAHPGCRCLVVPTRQ